MAASICVVLVGHNSADLPPRQVSFFIFATYSTCSGMSHTLFSCSHVWRLLVFVNCDRSLPFFGWPWLGVSRYKMCCLLVAFVPVRCYGSDTCIYSSHSESVRLSARWFFYIVSWARSLTVASRLRCGMLAGGQKAAIDRCCLSYG